MLRFFGQPKFEVKGKSQRVLGYELFLRENTDGIWHLPKDFNCVSSKEMVDLLQKTMKYLAKEPLTFISFNLDQPQFVDPTYPYLLDDLQKQYPNCHIVVELTEHSYDTVSDEALVEAAKKYRAKQISVCLDDVSFGSNQAKLADCLDPYLKEYKFPLQNYRSILNETKFSDVLVAVDYWSNRAKNHNLSIAIEGIEETTDLDLASEYHVDIVQGYFLGTPKLIAF